MSRKTIREYKEPVPLVREFDLRKGKVIIVEYTPLRNIELLTLYMRPQTMDSLRVALLNSGDPELKLISEKIESQSMLLGSKDTQCIPEGIYCHSMGEDNYTCPYWSIAEDMPHQIDGYCKFLERGDWQIDPGHSLLWDQCKVCGINVGDKHDKTTTPKNS